MGKDEMLKHGEGRKQERTGPRKETTIIRSREEPIAFCDYVAEFEKMMSLKFGTIDERLFLLRRLLYRVVLLRRTEV